MMTDLNVSHDFDASEFTALVTFHTFDAQRLVNDVCLFLLTGNGFDRAF
jgi:hypothetical protein